MQILREAVHTQVSSRPHVRRALNWALLPKTDELDLETNWEHESLNN